MSERTAPRVPVILVTGFLGSGKTTMVNRLLKTPPFARAAVIVNEYGKVSIDHVLVQAPRARVRVIDGGCLCGHVHEEVATSLFDLHARRGRDVDFDSVLVEMSGLADPVPVIGVLLTDSHLAADYGLTAVVALADGVHGARHVGSCRESAKQVAVADTIVISKTDIADRAGLDLLAARLAAMNPGARQLRAAHGEIDPAELLDRVGFDAPARSAAVGGWLGGASCAAAGAAAGGPAASSFVLTYDREIALPGFVLWMNLLAGFRGAGLLRVKGIVNVEGRPYAVQAVQTVVSEPVALDGWPAGDDRRSRLVFITRGIDAADIERTFATFRFEDGRAARNTTINAEAYARFRDTIALFRTSPPDGSGPGETSEAR